MWHVKFRMFHYQSLKQDVGELRASLKSFGLVFVAYVTNV